MTRGANDEAEVVYSQAFDDFSQSAALLVGINAARNAHSCRSRGEDQVAPRDRDIRGDARALGADRLLGDLNYDILAFAQDGFDLWGIARAAKATPVPIA